MNRLHWTVPADHPALAGHFPGRPIVPGVVLLDQLLQWLAQTHPAADGGAGRNIGNAKFSSPALPGETLCFTLQEKAGGTLQFRIDCAGRDIASGTLTLPPAGSA